MSSTKRIEPGIYQRGPHQFQVKIRRNGHSVSRTFETLKAAREWRTIQLGKFTGNEYVDRKKERRTSLRMLLERFKEEVTPTKKGSRQEANRLDMWMRSDLASYSIAAVEPSDIAAWIAARKDEGKAPTTISNSVNLLSAVFKKAREWGFNIDNPCQGVARPKARAARFAVMNKVDQELLVQACARGRPWLPFVVRLALATGMRQGEIRHMHWDHIHKHHIHLTDSKNGEERDVPLTREASKIIDELRRALPRRLDGWVFGDPSKSARQGGFTEWQVQQAYRDAAKWAEENLGVKRLTFHDLRHVALTALAKYHDNVIELSQTSGHKTLEVLKRYLNTTAEEAAAKVRRREAAVQRRKRAAG